ncbi:C25 family cysteine peptidase [Flavisolibacter tropicus]|uniref:Gingipain domain-containing protein n=1 Tax=Flavisolibacter tropicus TaxID=1492898 RepID=A0A172U0E5_9BACT|nr:C25 family cysteine peptidase [Flavisolibacter tropicus]ANE52790.1 hypothetical protein SY85_22235 [Flavisolibacter tropicus]
MKKFFVCLLILSGFISKAQVYNNEWIDHSKTYYKFKVGKTGLHRIPQTVVSAAGLGSTPAEYFQLWRNGTQVPIYTTVSSGPMSASDYIEFWGEMNDGRPDKELYRNPGYQLNDKYSLLTDTAVYFLTVDPVVSNNLRLRDVANNVGGNTLAPEPYFMYTVGNYFNKARLNNGYAVNVGETLYSSSYDRGEGWTSAEIGGTPHTYTFSDLNVSTTGPDAKFTIALSGNRVNPRSYRVKVNSDSLLGKQMDYYNDSKDSGTFSASKLAATNKALIEVAQISSVGSDAMVIHKYELTYPRQFNFGAQQNFEFALPASASGNYLEIKNFNFGSVAPVLYDLTNGKRYVGNISTPTIVKVVLEPSLADRRLVLVSQVAANNTSIASLETRKFVDYAQASNQGNYIIITNSLLVPSSGANPIEDYKQYRSSVEGGSHSVVVAMIDELVDQFAFGIKKHPMAVRDFLLYAREQFTVKPKNVLLIGKGVNYVHQRVYENYADLDKLNLVPTFGWPASDILLACDKGYAIPKLPIGRLSVVSPTEISDYLNKIKEYESSQRVSSPLVKDRAWMKNVMHVVGASEPSLQRILDYYMQGYSNTISDTLFGAKVYTISKNSPEVVQEVNNGLIDKLFEDGLSLITYFGHSSVTTLAFDLNGPSKYNNPGKYPFFVALGCMAGDFYNFNTTRFVNKETLSEKFVLAPKRGSISFIASSSYGIPHYLDIYNSRFYKNISVNGYGESIGESMSATVSQTMSYTTQEDFYARSTCEQIALHGDPALKLNYFLKPDFVIEEPNLRVSPSFVSVTDKTFSLNAKILNIGRGINTDLIVEVKRELPNGSSGIIFRDTIPATRFEDSIHVLIPINPISDKGLNKLTVTIDPENLINESYETNNTITKEVVIYNDEIHPIYPYNYSIVNRQGIKLIASTANPFAEEKEYRLEVDTTESFQTPLSVKTIKAVGGIVEFNPGITFNDNSVYYWRVAPVSSSIRTWNSASFVYIPNHDLGFNQSHVDQHQYSEKQQITLNKRGRWNFDSVLQNLNIRNCVTISASSAETDFSIAINGDRSLLRNACGRSILAFNAFDPKTFKMFQNDKSGKYGNISCGRPMSDWTFEFDYLTSSSRRLARDFIDSIPNGYFVVVRNIMRYTQVGGFVNEWMADESTMGAGKTLYHKLKNAGFADLDSFYRHRAFIFIYQKGNSGFKPVSMFSDNEYDVIMLSQNFKTPDSIGHITSPLYGPSRKWKQVKWDGYTADQVSTDKVTFDIIGVRPDGSSQTLFANIDPVEKGQDVSTINPIDYPNLQLRMTSRDSINYTPYQLNFWRVTYDPVPEGAVAPNIFFNMKDTFDVGEPATLKLAYKNVSDVKFADSIKAKLTVTDRNNITHTLSVPRQKPLISGDTLILTYDIPTQNLEGNNTLFVELNPDRDQNEQYYFNNNVFHDFFVKGDTLNPVLDVTFDDRHILNGDIVAAKPRIQIKLKDEARYMLLDNESLVTVQVKYPNEQTPRSFNFNSDTLRFTKAVESSGSENEATIDFMPDLTEDGDYELIVSGKDKSGNRAGELEYRVNFQVVRKPMISNMLNYPNPFTTSTSFVFTITGSDVPQNLRIQIMTITGKVVREITKEELGRLHIGRNITEYKWDGTDQYGQKLGNGVYLYRVITNLNGKALEKYKSANGDTDKYFNNGYGKMYLMR